MVCGLPLVLALGTSLFQQVTLEQAVSLVEALRERGVRGVGSVPQGQPLSTSAPVVDGTSDPLCFKVRHFASSAHVRKSDGHIRLYHDSGPLESMSSTWSANALSVHQVQSLVQEYYNLASATPTDLIFWAVLQEQDGAPMQYRIVFSANLAGFPYSETCEAEVEHVTGRLIGIDTHLFIPQPPSNTTVNVSEANARQVALAYMAQNKGATVLEESLPLRVVAWKPDYPVENPEAFLSTEQVQAAQAGRAVLAWYGKFLDHTGSSPKGGAPRFFEVYIDAHSGQLSEIVTYTAAGGDLSLKPPHGWDLGLGRLAVGAHDKQQVVPQADVGLVSVKSLAGAPKGDRVTLTRGALSLVCYFDRATGLLTVDRNGRRSFGKPNPALLRALLELTPASSPPPRPGRSAGTGAAGSKPPRARS